MDDLFLAIFGAAIFAAIFLFFAMKFVNKFANKNTHICVKREIIHEDKPKRK